MISPRLPARSMPFPPERAADAWPRAIKHSTSSRARLCVSYRFPIRGPMLSRPRTLPAGFIAPCLPTNGPQPPCGEEWVHEIKHDGFRVIARKEGKRVKLYSRPGNDLTYRFPLIVEAIAKLRSRSCIIDGEAVACGEDGIDRQKMRPCFPRRS
jgi:ATP-dependent DNA ligase